MQKIFKLLICIFIGIFFLHAKASSQIRDTADTSSAYRSAIAGPEYKHSSFQQWLWGRNYRKEWITPVIVPVLILDTAKGGLIPYKAGGGHQTKSLHLKTKEDKEYALRSVNKNVSQVLPESFKHTFLEDMANDKISMSHPYGAVSVTLMEEKADIYHTSPINVFLPQQPALDSFNKKFGNDLYLFEQRLDGDWSDDDNLGNFKKFHSTEEILEKLYKDNNCSIDQPAFIKARLFDMLINDWDRHEDQWAWGEVDSGNKKIYEPIPQDRDQAYFNYNGVLLGLVITAAGLHYLQKFEDKIPEIKTFNYEERNLDRLFTNQMTLDHWVHAASELQSLLTDDVIERSIKQLPPEIFAISGNKIISKLKARRSHLIEYASAYYLFIAKEVEIPGSEQNEYFEIKRLNDDQTVINVRSKNDKEEAGTLFYSRLFNIHETKEVRLYGVSGKDIYTIEGDANNKMMVRIIGGDERDSIIDHSSNKTAGKITVYDDKNNFFQPAPGTKLHLSADTAIHDFKYDAYLYDKRGFIPAISYSNEDRIFIGAGYQYIHHKWRKLPFASKQVLDVHYSISQKAFSVSYLALIPYAAGKWDLALKANYDAVRWTNFFGLGNETAFVIKDINYYRMRTKEWIFNPEMIKKFGMNTISAGGFYQIIAIINDTNRFVGKAFISNPEMFETKKYAGGLVNYSFRQLNDSVVPTKGFIFSASAAYTKGLQQNASSFTRLAGNLELYVPLVSKFSFVLRTGAATVEGNPEFYQYASIGGPTLRGFRRDRFWGKTALYNTNDLRFITNIRTHIFNGKGGLIAFFDNGRVWMPGENSGVWHTGYGAGIVLAPFNKILANITYGISSEEKIIQVRISKYF